MSLVNSDEAYDCINCDTVKKRMLNCFLDKEIYNPENKNIVYYDRYLDLKLNVCPLKYVNSDINYLLFLYSNYKNGIMLDSCGLRDQNSFYLELMKRLSNYDNYIKNKKAEKRNKESSNISKHKGRHGK